MVCNKEYEACPSCEDTRLNPWRKTVCCAEHFQIRMVFLDYLDGRITANEAKDMLETVGLTDGAGLRAGYRDFFNKLFGGKKAKAVSKKK